jgi:alpha-N-acetylglucosamine transferase
LSCHSVAVVLTLVQTKQIRINIHKQNNTKNTVKTIQNAVHTRIHITKIPTHTHTHTLQNKLKQPQYKLKKTVQDIL